MPIQVFSFINSKFLFCFQFSINKLTDLLRIDIASAGFTEALTFALVGLYLLPSLVVMLAGF